MDRVRRAGGALAQAVFPGGQAAGLAATLMLGLAGALTGGFVASALGVGGIGGVNLWSLLAAIGGAVALIAIYEAVAPLSRAPRS